MNKNIKYLLIITASILFFYLSHKSAYAQTYTCRWDLSDVCVFNTSCPEKCTYSTPCSTITNPSDCSPTRQLPCNCSEQLNLQTLYSKIQSKPAKFNFSATTVGGIVSVLVNFLLPIAGLIFLLILISSGFKMMTSAGDPKRIASARSGLTTGLVGFIIIFTAFWLVQIIGSILGLTDITTIF